MVDISDEKLAFAAKFGFEAYDEKRDGKADCVLEGTGVSPALNNAILALKSHGRLVLMGNPARDMTINQSTYTYEDGSNKSHTVDLQGGSLEDSTNDPKNYYKRYETSSYYTDYVRFYSDGTAEYHEYGGSYDQYEFMYVNRGWLEAYGLYDSYSYDKALVLFNDENIMIFEYINSNTIEDENGTRFTY